MHQRRGGLMTNSVRTRVFILSCFVLAIIFIVGCASTAPLPQTLDIVAPSADIPKEIAAFSGIWEGRWHGLVDTYLVVQEINNESAKIIMSIGITSSTPDGMFFYATTNVLPGPTLKWTDPEGNKYTYTMDKSLNKIMAYMEEKATGAKAPAYMERRPSK
jgi:hypothetical protein